ncbi:MAG: AAA family ATPase [Blautia sp.]|nr:AAA family ATPase [Blautia sp.]
MKKEKLTEKELEALERLTDAEDTLMKDLYGDLFGGGNSTRKKERTPKKDDSLPSTEEILKKAEEDAVKKAQDALKEAKELLGREPELSFPGRKAETDKAEPKPGEEAKESQQQEEKPKEPEKDPMEQLDELIGLTTIKHDVKELADFARIQKMRKDEGLKSVPVSMHLVFTGNPGTGKTTVARILAKLYKNIGVLTGGQLIEVDRSGLVAGYVGQTAIKTQEAIQKAMGGVLFIDEAYALARKDDTFGQEAIDTILKAMEDHRDEFVVIVAGYTGPMETFINSNPGLKSRFNKYIEFPDYTVDELEGIFKLNCKKYDYTVDDDVMRQIREIIKLRKFEKCENFANAREVRNMFEEFITNQARRVAAMEAPTHEDMVAITLADLMDEDMQEKKEEAPVSEETATEAENVVSGEDAAPAEDKAIPAENDTIPEEDVVSGQEDTIPAEEAAEEDVDMTAEETENE